MFDAGSDAIPSRSHSNRIPKVIASDKIKNDFTGEEKWENLLCWVEG